jgi:hypothetical protein
VRLRLLLAASPLLAGCLGEPEDAHSATGPTGVQGLVVVERLEWWGTDDDGSAQSNVSARVLRMVRQPTWQRDVRLAERAVGAGLDAPPLGTCAPLGAEPPPDSLEDLGRLELLPAGEVQLEADGARIPLAVRAFPDVGARVSGVFYTSEDAQIDLPAGTTYSIRLGGRAGTSRQGEIEKHVVAPSSLEGLSLGGVALASGEAFLSAGRAADLTWLAPVDAWSSDVILADVVALDGTGMRCAFADAGQGTLSIGSLVLSGDEAFVLVHRVRSADLGSGDGEEIDVDGLGVRFDLAVSTRVRVEGAPAGPN